MGDNTAEVFEDDANDNDTAPTGLVVIQPVDGGYMVNGVLATEATHVFRDGKPVLKADGTPKRKPGRKAGISPFKKTPSLVVQPVVAVREEPVVLGAKLDPAELANPPAKHPPVMDPAELETKVPLSVGTADAVSASVREIDTVAAMGISALSHDKVPLIEEAPVKVQKWQVPTSVTVQRSFGKADAPNATEETLEVKTFAVQPATVELGYGLTLNIGNYESARVDVRISVPCYREETDAAFEWAKGWAEARVRDEVNSIKKMAIPAKSNPF